MKPKRTFFGAVIAVLLIATSLPVQKVFAQAEDGNHYSTPIEMVVNAGTNEERQQTSQFGIMEMVALRPSEQIAITLIASVGIRGYPVGIAPLDGGAILGGEDLVVADDGTVGFTFAGGDSPGFYRVLVTIGAEQYQLQFYVVTPKQPDGICP